jgi:MFS family permease
MELINYVSLRPTLGGSFSNGWQVMKKYFLYLLLVVIVVGMVTGPSVGFKINYNSGDYGFIHSFPFNGDNILLSIGAFFLILFGIAYYFLVVPVFEYSAKLIYIDAVRDKDIEFQKLIAGFHNYLNVILANLLKSALVAMGFIFFIIPGIILICRLSFVSYLVMDKELDAIQAIEQSWKLTRGIGWTIFGMGIFSFFIIICGLALLIVGIFPAIIWVNSSFASLYQAAINTHESYLE